MGFQGMLQSNFPPIFFVAVCRQPCQEIRPEKLCRSRRRLGT
jgi:hypothetical protein